MVTPSDVTPTPPRTPTPRRRLTPLPPARRTDASGLPPIVPRRHVGRLPAAAAPLLAFAMVLTPSSATRPSNGAWWARYFTTSAVLDGLLLTLWLTAVVMVLGFLLGTLLAGDAALRQPGAADAELGLCVDLPVHAAAGAAAVLVQHRRPVPDARPRRPVRPGVRHRQDGEPVRPGPHRRHRPDPARGRLRRRGGARRHPLRGLRPDGGRAGPRAGQRRAPCAGSSSRRRCAPSCRPPGTC